MLSHHLTQPQEANDTQADSGDPRGHQDYITRGSRRRSASINIDFIPNKTLRRYPTYADYETLFVCLQYYPSHVWALQPVSSKLLLPSATRLSAI